MRVRFAPLSAVSAVANLVASGAFVIACQAGVQVRAQSDEGVSARADVDNANAQSAPTPVSSAETAATGTAFGGATGVADGPPACPLHCVIATPSHRVLQPEEQERLRGAFAATMGGLRSCVYSERSDGRHRIRPPALTVRFAPSGDLLDVGVDGTGFGYSAESCFNGVVRGSTTGPDVRLEGPATVRCVERCEHHKTAQKKK